MTNLQPLDLRTVARPCMCWSCQPACSLPAPGGSYFTDTSYITCCHDPCDIQWLPMSKHFNLSILWFGDVWISPKPIAALQRCRPSYQPVRLWTDCLPRGELLRLVEAQLPLPLGRATKHAQVEHLAGEADELRSTGGTSRFLEKRPRFLR